MPKIAFRVLLYSSLALALLFSCDLPTDSNSEGSGNGSGDGQSISFVSDGELYVFTENLGAGYTAAEDESCVVGSDAFGAGAQNGVQIYFPGNDTGTFTDPPDSPDPDSGLPWLGILIESAYYAWEDGKGCWFVIDVTAYGSIGGRIEGTFSGELADGDTIIEVTDGAFSVMRYE